MLTSLTNRFQPTGTRAQYLSRSSSSSSFIVDNDPEAGHHGGSTILKLGSSNLTADTSVLSSSDNSIATIPSSSSVLSLESMEEGNGYTGSGHLQEPLLLFPEEPTKTNVATKASSWLDMLLEPRVSQGSLSLPLQSQARPMLKYLIVPPIAMFASTIFFTYYWVPLLLQNGAFAFVDNLIMLQMNRASWWLMIGLPLVWGLLSDMYNDVSTGILLLRARHRRALPTHMPRLTHAVIICNYKEPLEVLRATIQSLATNTLAANTMIVLACEDRDPSAQDTYRALEQEFAHKFKAFFQTRHVLAPGEIVGKSSNENYACREVHRILSEDYPELDPFQVMVTTCDADSLFDSVFLEQVEAEYCRMPDGRRFLYNAPINTYRNLPECHWFVRAFEIRRCHYDTFCGARKFRPTQSNYSLTLGFANELNYWDPSNTSEDFHTTLKAMAMTGKHDAVVVKVWSLILNDSVTDLKDRWVQAKRHMWGIEEVAFCASLFPVLRLGTWASIMSLATGQMYSVCIPAVVFLCLGPVRQAFFSLSIETQYWMVGITVGYFVYNWIKVVLREVFLYRFILHDRSLMMQRSWSEWVQFIVGYPMMSQFGFYVFATMATWRMLIHAVFHDTLVYITAPKALTTTSSSPTTSSATVPDGGDNCGDIPSVIHSQIKQPKKAI